MIHSPAADGMASCPLPYGPFSQDPVSACQPRGLEDQSAFKIDHHDPIDPAIKKHVWKPHILVDDPPSSA